MVDYAKVSAMFLKLKLETEIPAEIPQDRIWNKLKYWIQMLHIHPSIPTLDGIMQILTALIKNN